MHVLKIVAYATAIVVSAYASNVSAQSLGASRYLVSRTYPDAMSTKVEGMAALELKDIDFAGVRWSKVDYVFNASGHLDHLSMSTSAADYDSVLHLATVQMNPPRRESSTTAVEESGSSDLQIRVCAEGGVVTMTFEPLSSLI